MAFIGVLVLLAAVAASVFFVGVVPIVLGTFLYHKTQYKKLGIILRIFGYAVILPVIFIGVFLFMRSKF